MIAEVQLWGRTIGAVSLEPGRDVAAFQYAADFAQSGIQLSPLMMPLATRVYEFPALPKMTFHGLPGLLADSLPDKFGHALIDAWLATQGRTPGSFDAVERLCYIGARGMGALEFKPTQGPVPRKSTRVEIDALVRLAGEVLTHRGNLQGHFDEAGREQALRDILSVGTSAGGARAKAVIAWNRETNEVRSGQVAAGEGFEYWLLKFDGVAGNRDKEMEDPRGYGAIEFAYYLMAQAAGITMSECRLLEENGRRHFMTRRFDRLPGGAKLHMQSLGAMAHFDFNQAGAYAYEQALLVIRQLELPMAALEEQFRRMVFNVVARNQDDHVKNIAFLMNRQGEWALAPAFDVTYSYNPSGAWTATHQMTLNGKRDGFTLEDFAACAQSALLKRGRAETILGEVQAAVKRWPEFAAQAGLSDAWRDGIQQNHRLSFPEKDDAGGARLTAYIPGQEHHGGWTMDDQTLNRRQILGGMAMAAGAAGVLGGLGAGNARAADAPAAADAGTSQAPTITDVKDKVVYITGGSSGIGLGIARVMHEYGAKVVIGNLDDKQFADALKNFPTDDPRLFPIVHDVMDRDGWQRTADAIEKKFGPVDILVNNAGVGLQQSAATGSFKDWEWGLGVNLWGPIHGVNTFVPRMLARKTGAHIVTTTSTSGILPGSGAGIYTVSKIAAVGLMEELRHELRESNIGTSAFVPGLTTTNIGQSETHRPDSLKNEAPPASAAGARRPAGAGAPAARPPAPVVSPAWTRPQDPVTVGRFVLDGILHNDLFIVLQPEYRQGVEARCNALLESMVPFTPIPEHMKNGNYLRTPNLRAGSRASPRDSKTPDQGHLIDGRRPVALAMRSRMQNASSPTAYLTGLKGWTKTIASSLRRAVRSAAPLEEKLKWGHLVYSATSGPVCLIRAEPERVLFGFWRGQRLRHLEPRLKPGGKYEMATLELRADDSVTPALARQLVAEAVELNARLGDPTDLSSSRPKARKEKQS